MPGRKDGREDRSSERGDTHETRCDQTPRRHRLRIKRAKVSRTHDEIPRLSPSRRTDRFDKLFIFTAQLPLERLTISPQRSTGFGSNEPSRNDEVQSRAPQSARTNKRKKNGFLNRHGIAIARTSDTHCRNDEPISILYEKPAGVRANKPCQCTGIRHCREPGQVSKLREPSTDGHIDGRSANVASGQLLEYT
jgi:hypothetical protein